jgi:serine phosphatase RsbU (regulator of sigma subunit)
MLTLLVPASFAWATAVHRIFDFRVALRAGAVTLLLAIGGGAAYAGGEWLAAMWWPDLGTGIAGGALAFVALTASLAGPAAPRLGSLGARMVPGEGDVSLAGWLPSRAIPGAAVAARDGTSMREIVLAEACETVCRFLRVDGCLALIVDNGGVRPVAALRPTAIREPGPGLRLRAAQFARAGVQSVEAAPLDPADREALELAGVSWLLPIGVDPVRAVLLLGQRLAGAWLSRREMITLERFAQHLAMMLENEALRREASTHGALERELREAGAIQAHLLPRHAPVYPTLDCAAAALSCEPVGGDYYDFVEGPGRDFTLAVGDAAGKGVPAALLLAQVQPRFRSQARSGLSPGQLLSVLNRELVGLDQPEHFVALLCARVDVRSARVWFANAGLTPPLVRRADGRFMEILAGGVLLGVSADASYPDACVDLDAGDLVVVYTDGLTEARRGEELFGVERVRRVLDRTARQRAVDVLEALLSEVRDFADHPLDDLTVVVLRQLTQPARIRPSVAQKTLKWRATPADAMG